MAKKALVNKQRQTPKFKVRGYTPLPAMRTTESGLPQVPALSRVSARTWSRR